MSASPQTYGTPTPSGKEAFISLYGNNMLKRQDIEENTGLQMKYAYHLNDLLKKEFYKKCQPEKTNDDEKYICKIIKDDTRWSDCFEDTKMKDNKWKCYICGGLINQNPYEMEVEHLLPFSFAAQYGMLVKKNTTGAIIKHGKLESDDTYVDDPEYPELKKINIQQGSLKMVTKDGKDLNINYTTESREKAKITIKNNEILLNPYQLLLSCLEMRPSHKCCNQIKSNALFIERDTKKQNKYIVKTEYIKDYLNTIKRAASKAGYKEDWFCDHDIDRVPRDLNVYDRTEHLKKYFGLMCDILNEYERKQFNHLFGKNGELNSDDLRKAASLNIMVQLATFDSYLKPDQFNQIMKSSPTQFKPEDLEEHVYVYLKEKNIQLCKSQPKRNKNEEEWEYYSKSFMTCFRENKLFVELARDFFDDRKIENYIKDVNPNKRISRNITQDFVQIFAPSLFKNNNLWELILKYYCRVFSQRTTINAGTLDFQDSISRDAGVDLVNICMLFIIYFAKKNNLCKDEIFKQIKLVSLKPYLTPGKNNIVKVKDVADFQRLEIELREIFSIALDEHIEQGVIEEQRKQIFTVIDEALSKNALKDLAEAALTDPLADLKEFVRNYKLPEGPRQYFNPKERSMTRGTGVYYENELNSNSNNNDFFNPKPQSVFRGTTGRNRYGYGGKKTKKYNKKTKMNKKKISKKNTKKNKKNVRKMTRKNKQKK